MSETKETVKRLGWRDWTAAEEAQIVEWRGTLSTKEIAARLGRTPAAIVKRKREIEARLGVTEGEEQAQDGAPVAPSPAPCELADENEAGRKFAAVVALARLSEGSRAEVLDWVTQAEAFDE